MENQLLSQVLTRLPLVPPKWEFSPLSVGTYYGVSGVGEAGRTSELYLGSHNLPTHSYTYISDPCMFWWDSDAPDPGTAKPYARWKKVKHVDLPL